jgi:hypothetical protein
LYRRLGRPQGWSGRLQGYVNKLNIGVKLLATQITENMHGMDPLRKPIMFKNKIINCQNKLPLKTPLLCSTASA